MWSRDAFQLSREKRKALGWKMLPLGESKCSSLIFLKVLLLTPGLPKEV
jgi:hypothetical protein